MRIFPSNTLGERFSLIYGVRAYARFIVLKM